MVNALSLPVDHRSSSVDQGFHIIYSDSRLSVHEKALAQQVISKAVDKNNEPLFSDLII